MAICQGCGDIIHWRLVVNSDKRIPLDDQPSLTGRFLMYVDNTCESVPEDILAEHGFDSYEIHRCEGEEWLRSENL